MSPFCRVSSLQMRAVYSTEFLSLSSSDSALYTPPRSSLLPTKALPYPLTVQTAQAGRGRAEKATYLGDWAWKSNLSRAAFLWERGEDGTEWVTSARQGPAQTLPDPLTRGDSLTFFSSFLAGLLPLSEALGSVEKHHLSLRRSCLGGSGWDRLCSPHPGQAQGSKDSVTLLAPTLPFLGHHRACKRTPRAGRPPFSANKNRICLTSG